MEIDAVHGEKSKRGKHVKGKKGKEKHKGKHDLWLGRSQTSNAHLIGSRVGIVVACTIRRLPTSEREESSLGVAMRGTPVAGRPADAAADDAATVTRHEVERREVIVVPAISGAPLQAGNGEGVSAPSNPVKNLPKPTVARAQPSSAAVESRHHPSGERVDSSGPGGDVPVEVAQAVESTTKSHAQVEEHDESLVPKRQRGRPATHCWPSAGSPEYTVSCPGCDERSNRHLLKCQQKRVELGLTASSSLRVVRDGMSWKRRHRLLHLLNRHQC